MSVRKVEFQNLLDVPARLRELADTVEREGLKTVIVVVGPYEGGRVAVRGYGERTDSLQCVGWLHRALDAMTDGAGIETTTNPVDQPPRSA